jgi:hypothetical protein
MLLHFPLPKTYWESFVELRLLSNSTIRLVGSLEEDANKYNAHTYSEISFNGFIDVPNSD